MVKDFRGRWKPQLAMWVDGIREAVRSLKHREVVPASVFGDKKITLLVFPCQAVGRFSHAHDAMGCHGSHKCRIMLPYTVVNSVHHIWHTPSRSQVTATYLLFKCVQMLLYG
jgi:hypothetical protein